MPRCCCLSFLVIKPNQGVRQEKRQTRERERTTDAKEQMLAGCPGLPTRPLIYRHKQELGEWTRVEWRAQRAVSVQFRFSSLLFSSLLFLPERKRERERIQFSILPTGRNGEMRRSPGGGPALSSTLHRPTVAAVAQSFLLLLLLETRLRQNKEEIETLWPRSLARYVFQSFNPPQSTAPYSAANKKKKKIIRLCLTSIFIY